jgi:adenylate cyclase class IV
MPTGTSSFCKQCGKIAPAGVYGRLLNGKQGYRGVCICAQTAKLRLAVESGIETTSTPSLMCETALKAGTSTSDDSLWSPKVDKSSANPVTPLNLKPKTRSEEQRNSGREIERKYRVLDEVSLNTLHHHILGIYPNSVYSQGKSIDIFWKHPGVDFIRLRENTQELTVKITDKDDITDRVEINVEVKDYARAAEWATTVFGKPAFHNRTFFHIYEIPTVEITIYEVEGYPQVFLEVESNSIEEIKKIETKLVQTISLKQEFKSLFQIIMGTK